MSKKKGKSKKISQEDLNKRSKGLELIEAWMLKLEKTNELNSKNE
ncbi:hypothetical protein [Psychrobacillus psychrotolerans]